MRPDERGAEPLVGVFGPAGSSMPVKWLGRGLEGGENLVMAQQQVGDVLRRYLQDAIAAEESFEDQLRTMAKDSEQPEVQQVFAQHADETRSQHERLKVRLDALGGNPSTMKSWMAHLFGMTPKIGQMGHDDAEKGTQNLIAAYAVEHTEIAMYEALACAASVVGDTETEQLARQIQREEKMAAEKVWNLLPAAATQSFAKVTGLSYGAGVSGMGMTGSSTVGSTVDADETVPIA
ncbi:MAG: hypothetical protein C4321_08695 [Chloroflexota bacterium]